MQYELFDYINSINHKTKLDNPDFVDYKPFVVCSFLSKFQDTLAYAYELSYRSNMDKDMQYEYLKAMAPNCRRYAPNLKKRKPTEIEEFVADEYMVNIEQAREIIATAPDEEIERIIKKRNLGGQSNKKTA